MEDIGLCSFEDRLLCCDVEEADALWKEVLIGYPITFLNASL